MGQYKRAGSWCQHVALDPIRSLGVVGGVSRTVAVAMTGAHRRRLTSITTHEATVTHLDTIFIATQPSPTPADMPFGRGCLSPSAVTRSRRSVRGETPHVAAVAPIAQLVRLLVWASATFGTPMSAVHPANRQRGNTEAPGLVISQPV
jgi:hypothetical protein